MSRISLEEILKTLLVDPHLPIEDGGEALHLAMGLNIAQTYSWNPVLLSEKEIGKIGDMAYQGVRYKNLGCGYGAFSSFVKIYAEKLGGVYAQFPLEALMHKKGRYSGPGKTCGALLGADKIFAMFYDSAEARELSEKLYAWYTNAMLPDYRPSLDVIQAVGVTSEGDPIAQNIDINLSAAGSHLCADSLSSWVQSHETPPGEKDRKERCARVAASVAVKAALLMNEKI